MLFQIVDPKSLWVEAYDYGDTDPATLKHATAIGAGNVAMKLTLPGLEPHAATAGDRAAIRDRRPAAVDPRRPARHRHGATRRHRRPASSSTATPSCAAAMARPSSGAMSSRSMFEARPVRTEPFDATHVLIAAGIGDGERIVVRGAELINQIR